jgi:catechol 2,3-dioxygenase-like lactoylglutathione lyase family enzyme
VAIVKLAHYSIRTPDLQASIRFYTRVLGLQVGPRPDFPFPGAWLYRGGDEADYGVVHLIGTDAADSSGLQGYLGEKEPHQPGSGSIDHVAFLATGLQEMRATLRSESLAFRERTVPGLGLHQLFVEEPAGITVELNFPAAEAAAEPEGDPG